MSDNEETSGLPVRKIDRMRSRKKRKAPSGREFINIKDLRTPLRQELGRRIEEAVKEMGLTGDEAAKRIGVTYTTYRKYARGDSEVDVETLSVIADLTRRPIHWFYGSGDKGPDVADTVAYMAVCLMRDIDEGKDPLEAFDRAIAPARISPGFRRVLEDHAKGIRSRLVAWTDLSADERRLLMRKLQDLDGGPPSRGAGGP